ncbi:FAD/NAD(P)-binding protein [Salinactinospora qingdaonensis]|uniref:FAD/NAD(P)-binding protein n=1 Tax=Salinactinospora qingdaonensis TaxID=702744 RepID=A0ABP7F5N2_9ACTN
MPHEVPADGHRPIIACVGGGASATLTAIALLRATTWLRLPYRLVLFDEHGRHGRGTAYATTEEHHLLASPATTMSAIPEQPAHFVEWARSRNGDCRAATFLPRGDYGDYLWETLLATARWAEPHASLECRTARVVSATCDDRGVTLGLAGGERVNAAAAIVATGNARPSPLTAAAELGVPVIDPWAPETAGKTLQGHRRVLTIGTGLTMVDVALSVASAAPQARIDAVSRRGLLPHRHRPPVVMPPVAVDLSGPPALRTLTRRVRAAIAAYPGDWRHVVDSLRPHTAQLWQGLTREEQQIFLERFATYWESARHRMAPEAAEEVAALRASGRLRVHAGGIEGVEPGHEGVRARLGNGRVVEADAVADCTGAHPGSSPFLRGLLAQGLARPDHLGMGIDTCPHGALIDASGKVSRRLFGLGPVRRGRLYETTAIPEIREQAEHLAQRIADTVLRERPVSGGGVHVAG